VGTSIFDMLYLPWPDQKVTMDRKKNPNWDYWENAKVVNHNTVFSLEIQAF
jgi:hypothetical protein